MPPVRRDLRRDLPLDPALAKLLGIKAQASVAPQRQQPVQPQGRVARADIGLAGQQPIPH